MKIIFRDVIDGSLASGLFKLMSRLTSYRQKVALLPVYDAIRIVYPELAKHQNERLALYRAYEELQDGKRVLNLEKMSPEVREMFDKESLEFGERVVFEGDEIEVEVGESVLNSIDFDGNELWSLCKKVKIKERADSETEKLRARVAELEKQAASRR